MNNYCSNCGESLEGAKFCPNCGEPVSIKKDANVEFVSTEYREPSQRIQDVQKPYMNPKPAAGRKKKPGCLVFIIAFVVLLGAGGLVAFLQNNVIQKSVSGVSDDSEYITLDEYNSIENGMTYKEVTKLIGSKGTSTSESSSGNITIKIITWYGNGIAGSNANVTFTNNKVTGKAQVGLK